MNEDRSAHSIIQGIRTIPMNQHDRVRAEHHVRRSAALMDMVLRLAGMGNDDKATPAVR